MQVAAQILPARKPLSVGPSEAAMRKARTCYDHLAGRLGVALTDSLVSAGHVQLGDEAGDLTDSGLAFLGDLGIGVVHLAERRGARSGRILCRPCLDWSERRPHLAGLVGSVLCQHGLAEGWIRRTPSSRAILVTPKGERIFRERFRLPADWAGDSLRPVSGPVKQTSN